MHTPEFRFRLNERTPEHTTFTVFVGPEGQGGNAGRLTLTNEEYDSLAPLLLAAPTLLAALKKIAEGECHDDGCDPYDRCSCEQQCAREGIEAAS